jgi:hypothetical protein
MGGSASWNEWLLPDHKRRERLPKLDERILFTVNDGAIW